VKIITFLIFLSFNVYAQNCDQLQGALGNLSNGFNAMDRDIKGSDCNNDEFRECQDNSHFK
jgi:hypothetical protein